MDDIFNSDGLRSFQDLCNSFAIPGTSYFLYLRLRSVLCAYGVPWHSQLVDHPLLEHLNNFTSSGGLVSYLYDLLIKTKNSNIGSVFAWNTELSALGVTPDWDVIWHNIFTSSKNLSHQLIHFKLLHRLYITPCRANRFCWGLHSYVLAVPTHYVFLGLRGANSV